MTHINAFVQEFEKAKGAIEEGKARFLAAEAALRAHPDFELSLLGEAVPEVAPDTEVAEEKVTEPEVEAKPVNADSAQNVVVGEVTEEASLPEEPVQPGGQKVPVTQG